MISWIDFETRPSTKLSARYSADASEQLPREIKGVQYDIISGISGGGIASRFKRIQPGPSVGGQVTYRCRIGATEHTFRRIGQSANILSEFVAEPRITS